MSDWMTALKRAGIASPRVLAEAEAQTQLDAEASATARKKADSGRERRLEILRTTNSVSTFRHDAHKLLLDFPELVGDVVELAHQRKIHERKRDGGGRLIADLLELRRSLSESGLHDESRAECVRRILPKNMNGKK